MAPGTYRLPRQPRYQPTGTMRKAVASQMRRLSADIRDRHPELGAHEHISDAARALDRNQHEAAQRHLRAAIENMTPTNLRRHGLLTDDQHDQAKRSMDAIHRHLLLVRDIQEIHEHNQQLPYAETRGDGIGDDGLNEKPTARQPGGDRALNAPARQNIGRIDINVTKPQQFTRPKTAEQIAASNGEDFPSIELAGPHGYKHGWIYVGPGEPTDANAAKYHGKSGIRGAKLGERGVAVGTYNHHAKTITDRNGVSHKVRAIDPTAYEAGFHGDIASSHLPADIKQAMLGYSRGYRTGAVTRRINSEAAAQARVYGTAQFSNQAIMQRVIELASSGGHHIPGTPYTYRHGWLKVAGSQPKGVNADKPAADTMKVDDLRAHLNSYHSGMPVFGRTTRINRKADLLSFHERMHQAMEEADRNNRPRPVTEKGELVDWGLAHTHGMGSVTETVASGTAEPLGLKGLSPREQVAYARLRQLGHSHPEAVRRAKAIASGAGKVAGAVGRALGAGSTTETLLENSGRQPGIELTGPKGYKHGWHFVGVPGTPEHSRFLRGFAGSMGSSGAAGEVRQAADAIDRRDINSAGQHLDNAYNKRRAEVAAARLTGGRAAANKIAGDVYELDRHVRQLSTIQTSNTARDVKRLIELSAQTPGLAATPHPFGKPGGPGLWHTKGMELPPYIQNIAHAILREGRARNLSHAIAIAKASTSKWARTSKHPEVRAASAATNADWEAKRARAHAHANIARLVIELTGTAAGAAKDQRVPAGQPGGGTFGSGQGGKPQTAHQKHVAHIAHMKTMAGKRQQLASDQKQLTALQKQRAALVKSMASARASAAGKTSKGQAGATTKSTATTKSSAPATAKTSSTAVKSTAKTASKASPAQQLKALNTQIAQLQAQIKQLRAQGA